jgi:VWFA-related protein
MGTGSASKFKVLLALISLLFPLCGQDSAPLVRSHSRLVLLDVVVTDKEGHPIRGLSQNDFSVLENGMPQKVTSFEATSTEGASVQANTSRNLILLDELNISFSDLSYARDRILLFLERNPVEEHPTCLMAVGMHGLVMVQDFTQDSGLLKDKLAHLAPVLANQKGDEIDNDLAEPHARAALEALTQIARAAVGSTYSVNVIWVTSGFPGLVQTPSSNDRVDAGLRGVANLLIRSRMRLYTIDPAGVVPLAAMASAPKMTRGSARDSHVSSANQLLNSTHGEAMTADVLLRHMTKIMGGLSYRGRNDVEEALSQAIEDGTSAYLISYSPSNTTFDGGYRKIEVNIDVAGATARTREGYYAVSNDFQPDREKTDALLENAMSSVASYGALNVLCPANYDTRRNRLTGRIVVKPAQVAAAADQKSQVIRMASFSKDHKLLNSWLWRVSWKDPWMNREVSASFDKVVSPKANVVRFLVSDATAERIGSCEYLVQ